MFVGAGHLHVCPLSCTCTAGMTKGLVRPARAAIDGRVMTGTVPVKMMNAAKAENAVALRSVPGSMENLRLSGRVLPL